MNTFDENLPEETPAEPAIYAVTALENHLKIGSAIVAAGPVDFPLTLTDAKALEALGKVKIEGLFKKSA